MHSRKRIGSPPKDLGSSSESASNDEDGRVPQSVNVDWLLSNRIGFGRQQIFMYCVIGLASAYIGMHAFAWQFLAAPQKHRCLLNGESETTANYSDLPPGKTFENSYPPEGNGSYSQCEKYEESYSILAGTLRGNVTRKVVSCNGTYVFDKTIHETSARTYFEMICDNAVWYAGGDTIYKVGILCGSMMFVPASDICGRSPIFGIAICLQVVFGFILSFASHYVVLMVSRFFIGMANNGVFVMAFILGTELVPKEYRMAASIGIQYFYALGMVVCAVVAYVFRKWRQRQIALTIPGICLLGSYLILPESVRWLLAKGRKADAIKIMRTAAISNDKEIPENELDSLAEDGPVVTDLVRISDVLQYKRLCYNCLNIWFTWFVTCMVYNGLSINSVNLEGNEFVNFILLSVMEIPAYTFALLTLNRFGRSWMLAFCMIGSGICLLSCGYIPIEQTGWLLFLNMGGKLFCSAAYGIVYLYTAEVVPTVIRSSIMGYSSIAARFGSILSDYIIYGQKYWPGLPHLVFGMLSMISGVSGFLFLPETAGKRLPDTLQDGENIGRSDYV